MVTCIDITSLYKEKRGKALAIINFLCQVQHDNITYIYDHHVIDEKFIYIEMEAPLVISQWKTLCKKKFAMEEIIGIMNQLACGLEFLHSLNFVHRDVHPSRI